MNPDNPEKTRAEAYQKLALNTPTDANIWAELLRMTIESHDLELSRCVSQVCSEICGETEWIRLYKAYLSLKEGDSASTVDSLRELAATTEDQAIIMWAKKWMIDALLDQGETDEAAALLLESRNQLPQSVDIASAENQITDYLESRTDSAMITNQGNFPVSLIAFYLPQFHPFPENDQWWGAGFSEWVNIADAEAHFPEHYQPRRPGALGFYDLRSSLTQRQQSILAKKYGVSALCYYLYWFSGKELMQEPLKNMLDDQAIDISFCLCWANETWSRRWDGSESDILIEQKYTEEDRLEFPKYVSTFFHDRRYFKVSGKPLLLVYRPDQIPNTLETTELWRSVFREIGIGEVHLTACLTFGYTAEKALLDGFDSSNEFHPHNSVANEISKASMRAKKFDGKIYDYREVVANSIKSLSVKGVKDTHPCVMLAWDNTPRRGPKGNVFTYFDFHYYGAWIFINKLKIQLAEKNPALLFVNAWNEWCEGTYLEPDRYNGFKALETTFEATKLERSLPILLVALKLTATYYENIRVFLLRQLAVASLEYIDFIEYLIKNRKETPRHLFTVHQDTLATYYYEKRDVIICAEVDASSSQHPSYLLRGWMSSAKLTLPTSARVLIGTDSEYCKREATIRLHIGGHRDDVATYHTQNGRSFAVSNDWTIDISLLSLSENEIIQAIIFDLDDWLEAARLNTRITPYIDPGAEADQDLILLDRGSEFSRLSTFWRKCADIPWDKSSPELRGSFFNSIDQAYFAYQEISGALE